MAADIVMALLQLHPEYGERRGGTVKLDAASGERATAAIVDRQGAGTPRLGRLEGDLTGGC